MGQVSSRQAVLDAIAEYDAVGEERFLARYGFGRGRTVWLHHDGNVYPAKAILGASHHYEFPDAEPLTPSDFTSGAPTVRKLESLGFEVQNTTSADYDGADLTLLLEEALEAVANRDEPEMRRVVGQQLTAAVKRLLGDRPVSSGTGFGRTADVPWVGAYANGVHPTAQQGVYAVYLFARDGSAVYLSFNQGTEHLRGGSAPLRKRALDMRDAAGVTDPGATVELKSSNARPQAYEAGNAYAIRYDAGAVPDTTVLVRDLERMLAFVDRATASGLTFDPTREPLHVVFKWSAERNPRTLDAARSAAAERGYVWWKLLGSRPMNAGRLRALQSQLADGVPTTVFLSGGESLVRATLTEITADPSRVTAEDRSAVPPDAPATVFARITELADVSLDWALANLVSATRPHPDPDPLRRALRTTANPLYVFQRFSPRAVSRPTTLSLAELAERTFWSQTDLEELLDALDPDAGKGQVILAGPPGTGKTWIARLVAEYLTRGDRSRLETVQFHPSYGYEEFVEGIRPVSRKGGIVFDPVEGTVLRMADAITLDGALRVLVVDELNRANVPRVFGELLYLLEYRDEQITLQYSERFALPRGLRLIATMNTADRSVRSIDVALRRRFEVFECKPDVGALERFYALPENSNSVENLTAGFVKLNERLTAELDRHHTIGHAFFMRRHHDWARLERTWKRQIKPLVEDYFFDRPDLVEEFELTQFWTPPK